MVDGTTNTTRPPTASEMRHRAEADRRHREVPAKVARWREIARQLPERG